MSITPTRLILAIALLIALLLGGMFFILEFKGSASSPLYISLVEAPVPPTADAGDPVEEPAEDLEPPATGTSIGYAGYSTNPRAQTADLSIVAHHVAVPVDWTDGESAETTFRWPSADTDWAGTTAYHWLAFPAPLGHPNIPTGYETQHAVNLNGQRYEVLISEVALTIGTALETLTWSTVTAGD